MRDQTITFPATSHEIATTSMILAILDGCAWLCCGSVKDLIRECEGSFRRYADGSDTGECSTIDFTDMPFFRYHESVQRNAGMWEIQR